MSKLFLSRTTKVHFFACAISYFILLAVIIGSMTMKDNRLPQDNNTFTTIKPFKIGTRIIDDSVYTKIKAGEPIKLLGYDKGNSAGPGTFWVENAKGIRGNIYERDLGLPLFARNEDGEIIGEIAKINKENTFDYTCQMADGSTKDVDFEHIYVQLPDSIKVKNIGSEKNSSFIMTDKKFEQLFLGASFEENDKRYVAATNVAIVKDSLRARYPIKIYKIDTGESYAPYVTYDKDLKAVSVTYDYSNDRSDWVIRLLPLFGPIIDNGFFSSIINSSLYEPFADIDHNSSWWHYALAILIFIGMVLWWIALHLVLLFLMGALMHFPKVFYPFSNSILRYIFYLVATVCTYIWFVLLVAWGAHWILALPIVFVTIFMIFIIIGPLFPEAPSSRCIKCRRLDSMEYTNSEIDREYDEWMRETEYVKTISQKERRWKTWTETTTTYKDGHTSTSTSNHQDHKSIISTKLYDDYKVLYHVTVHKDFYKCVECGQIEHNFHNTYKELDRKYMGTHTETTEEEV